MIFTPQQDVKTKSIVKVIVAGGSLLLLASGASQGDDEADYGRNFRAQLSGFGEVHGPSLGVGAIFSSGSGRIKLKVDKGQREIDYELSYDFPDAAETPIAGDQFVNQAHLHFGQHHTTGGITVWLCEADNAAPSTVAADTPRCPSPSGTVNGKIRPHQVLEIATQGLPAGDDGFDALLKALRDKAIYANVHTDRFGPGEIRGQLDD